MNFPQSQDQNDADDKSGNGTAKNGKENLIGILEISGGVIFAILGVALSDVGFHYWSLLSYFLAICAAIGIVTHYARQSGFKHARKLFWFLIILNFLLFVFLIWKSEFPQPGPRPHFTVSLQIGDSSASTVILTNDCLFRASVINVITNFPNGFMFFNGVPSGILVIPVQPGESNKVFNFIAENDSPFTVNDLEIAIGLPKDWKLGLDSIKWRKIGEHLSIPGHNLEITNLQSWAAQSPYVLFPTDRLAFPAITNLDVPVWKDPSTKIENVRLLVRSTGFETLISANVLFLQTSNFSKPFLLAGQIGKDGHFHPSVSKEELEKEFEDSQK